MQRWHLTAGLASLAALATCLAPTSRARHQVPVVLSTPPVVVPTPLVEVTTPPIVQSSGGALHLSAGLDHPAVLRGQSQERYIVITVNADEVGGEPRPVNMAVVLDRSGSMQEQGKMEYARSAAKEVVNALGEGDRFSLITFSDRSNVVVASGSAEDPARLHRLIDSVYEGGGTNLYQGLADGQAQVMGALSDRSVNRVIVLSDGNANVGITRPSALAELSGRYSDSGLSVTTIGLGLDYNEDALAAMADAGGGTYRFVDSPDQLATIFQEELHQLDSVAAEGVMVNVDLPGVELIDVLGYDEQLTEGGFSVRLGDIYGGQTRKIVAKVRITGSGDLVDVADVRLTRTDAGEALAPVDVLASVTERPEVVDQTVQRELAILANEAQVSELALQANVAWNAGDVDEYADLLDNSQLIAGQAGSRYGAPSLKQQAKELELQEETYNNVTPTSTEGKRANKANKEQYRDWSH